MDEETRKWLKKKVQEIDSQGQVAEKVEETPEQKPVAEEQEGQKEIEGEVEAKEKDIEREMEAIPEGHEETKSDYLTTDIQKSEEPKETFGSKTTADISEMLAPEPEPVIKESKGMNWKIIIIMAAMGSAAGIAAFLVYKFVL